MYDDDDLNAAVTAGVLTSGAAAEFRAFAATRRATPVADEENFRLLTGFNDIFVTIAIVLTLVAVGVLAARVSTLIAGPCVAVASWFLAEYFTRRRRMALPSIVLLITFAGATGAGATEYFALPNVSLRSPSGIDGLALALGLAASCVAAGIHWLRFKVPITIAALSCTGLTAVIVTLLTSFPSLAAWYTLLILVAGLALFALALWWDASDPARKTRRSDVAFWLHLCAAPLIVHPVFAILGILGNGNAGTARALLAIAIYAALAFVALIIDRRAVLVSALAYVLYATSSLLRASGDLTTAFALTGLIIGSTLLTMSVWWRALRAPLVRTLPQDLRRCVPAP